MAKRFAANLKIRVPKVNLPKVKLLKGDSHDVIHANMNTLKAAGHSHAHAMHLSLKMSKSLKPKKIKSISAKVSKSSNVMKLKSFS